MANSSQSHDGTTPPAEPKPRRANLKPGEVLCNHCAAKCCRYFALPLDTPSTWEEFDSLRWFLMHDRAAVFVEDDCWYLLVQTPCKHLRPDNLCSIYATRPGICRQYKTGNCEFQENWVYDHFLETSEQVEEYVEAVLGPRRGASFRSEKPRGK
jgi:uncharacterized protein